MYELDKHIRMTNIKLIKFDEIKISFMHLGVLPPHFVIARI